MPARLRECAERHLEGGRGELLSVERSRARYPPVGGAARYVAPASWLVRADVESGRDELNLSHWAEDGDRADKAAEAIAGGEMPPGRYTLLHPEARLSDEEADQLIAALDAMNADRGDNSGPSGDDGGNSGPGGGGDDG